MYFAHGSDKSKAVCILTRSDLEFEAKKVKIDENGRFIVIKAEIQKCPFILANIYSPNVIA